MKKTVCLLVLVGLLCGCSAAETFETVADDPVQSVMAPMGTLELTLPEHAAAPVINNDDGSKLYFCDGYTLTEQVLQGGNLSKSMEEVCGFHMDALTVMQTQQGQIRRYEWVWTAAGEDGDLICRAVLLDDGAYHYCVCAMADADFASVLEPEWDSILCNIQLSA